MALVLLIWICPCVWWVQGLGPEKVADQSWLMNAEQSSGRELWYPTACVSGRERDFFFCWVFLQRCSHCSPQHWSALQVLNMTEYKIILTDKSLNLPHSWETREIRFLCLCSDMSPCPCLVFAEQMQWVNGPALILSPWLSRDLHEHTQPGIADALWIIFLLIS